MRICIVGGTGNISTSITRLLLQQGHDVTVFNRGQSGEVPAGVRVICGDRQDRAAFEQTMQAEKFDAAIDMICFTAEDAASSVRAFRGVRQLVHTSTVCTYGIQYDWLPVPEDHPLRPITDYGRNKVAADAVLMEAYYREGFPVTIIKPSTTFGPKWNLLRQVAWEAGWVDRIRKGKPILVCGDGSAIHQMLSTDDAALGFAGVLGKDRCLGQTYNLVNRGFTSWADYHRTAMRVIGREVELVGVPLADLVAANVPNVGICQEIFAHNTYYSCEKIMRDVPEFRPQVSLEEAIRRVYEVMVRENRIPDSDADTWEDRLITAQQAVAHAAV